MTIFICPLFGEEFSIPISPFPTNSFDDRHLSTLWKRSFQFQSLLLLQIPMTISICSLFDRGVFNSHRSFSYKFLWRYPSLFDRGVFRSHVPFCFKFLWRSPSVHSLKEEFSITISPFPLNSYDAPHLSTLWERSFQFPSLLFLQIPMTISICLLFERGVLN